MCSKLYYFFKYIFSLCFFFYDRVPIITRKIRIKPLSLSFCFNFSSWERKCNRISHDFIYQQLPFPKTTTTTQSTLLIHILLLITTISFCSIPTVLSHSNPIRLSTQHNINNNNNDDACGEWSRTPLVSSCPVKCFRSDPFCGMDGVTYWCECDDEDAKGPRWPRRVSVRLEIMGLLLLRLCSLFI